MQPIKYGLWYFFPELDRWSNLINNINFEEHYAEWETVAGHPLVGTKFHSYVVRLKVL